MAGLYIHIPFCSKRCLYCDFYSHTDMSHKKSYLEALCKEMEQRRSYIGTETIQTIYLGGGTPSQLTAEELNQIFSVVYSNYIVDADAEITIEVNPDDITPFYMAGLRDLPVNRISMGIQSFDENDLRFLNRRHTPLQAIEALSLFKENGYHNISIDLIYGLPGQSLEAWEQNIQKALELEIPHLSAYSLTYEESTPLYRLKEEGKIQPVDEELNLLQFQKLMEQTHQAGYQHYEISNFAKENYISRHNSSYWKGENYIGIGASAHSFNGTSRQWNVSFIKEYREGIMKNSPVTEVEYLDKRMSYNDSVITGLRTVWGLDLKQVHTRFGSELYDYCIRQATPHISKNLLIHKHNRLTLSREGLFISDSIMSDLMKI